MKKINIEYLNPFGAGILCGTLPDDLLKNFQDLSKEVLKKKQPHGIINLLVGYKMNGKYHIYYIKITILKIS